MGDDLIWWVRDAANSICGQTGAATHQKKLLKAAHEIERLRELLIVAVKELECGPDHSTYTRSICADSRRLLGLITETEN